MKRALLLTLCLSWATANAESQAPTSLALPAVSVQAASGAGALIAVPSAPLVFQVAQSVRVQPAQPELRLQPGYTTGTLSFTLFSEVNSEVQVISDDARLVMRGPAVLQLAAYTLLNVNAVSLEAHSGTLRVLNTKGELIARVPYVVVPAKSISQGVSLNYVPGAARIGLNYSVSSVNTSVLTPQWNLGLGLGLNTDTGNLGGGLTIGVNW